MFVHISNFPCVHIAQAEGRTQELQEQLSELERYSASLEFKVCVARLLTCLFKHAGHTTRPESSGTRFA